jgi:hypothetical protein
MLNFNLLGKDIGSVKKNTKAFLDAKEEIDVEVNAYRKSVYSCLFNRMQDEVTT